MRIESKQLFSHMLEETSFPIFIRGISTFDPLGGWVESKAKSLAKENK